MLKGSGQSSFFPLPCTTSCSLTAGGDGHAYPGHSCNLAATYLIVVVLQLCNHRACVDAASCVHTNRVFVLHHRSSRKEDTIAETSVRAISYFSRHGLYVHRLSQLDTNWHIRVVEQQVRVHAHCIHRFNIAQQGSCTRLTHVCSHNPSPPTSTNITLQDGTHAYMQ